MTDDAILKHVDDIVGKRKPPRPPRPPRPPKPKRVVQTHNQKRLLILSALKANPHGLTLNQIAAITGLDRFGCVPAVIEREHGYSIYIDHWTKIIGRWQPVYALCECPPDCPKP